MSCADCRELTSLITEGGPIYFLRVGNGNVGILACSSHAKELILAYREALENRNETPYRPDPAELGT